MSNGRIDSSTSQIIRGAPVTPGAGNLAGGCCSAIYAAVGGDVTATLLDGSVVTFAGLAGGVIHPIRALKITAATATGLLALYTW